MCKVNIFDLVGGLLHLNQCYWKYMKIKYTAYCYIGNFIQILKLVQIYLIKHTKHQSHHLNENILEYIHL